MLQHIQHSVIPNLGQPGMRQSFTEFLSIVVPEVMFYLRDHSTGTRDLARECLQLIMQCTLSGDMQTEMVALVSAGLAGMSVEMRTSSIDAFSRLFYEHGANLSGALRTNLVSIVLLLL